MGTSSSVEQHFRVGHDALADIRREAGVDHYFDHGGDPPTDEEMGRYVELLEAAVIVGETIRHNAVVALLNQLREASRGH